MRYLWCRLFGCTSVFAWFFRWPHRLCGWAAERRVDAEDVFTWDLPQIEWEPPHLIETDEVDLVTDSDADLVSLREMQHWL